MDKFHGIRRAEITNTRYSYEIVEKDLPKYRCVARSGDGEARAGKVETDSVLSDKAESDMLNEFSANNAMSYTVPDKAVSNVLGDDIPCSSDDCARQKSAGDIDYYAMTKPKSKPKTKEGRGGVFTALRYGLCAAVLLVCLLGKFTTLAPLKEASGFIKDELNREILTELYDADDE